MIRYCSECKSTIAPNGKRAIPYDRDKLVRLAEGMDITDGYCNQCAAIVSERNKAKRAKRAA